MLLYINIIQIILGIFLDMAAHILITTPLFLPLAIQMGVGPVQFGMMLLLNCALGLVHLRHRQHIHRRGHKNRLAVLPCYLRSHNSGDLRAGILNVAAVLDHRASRALGVGKPS
jgi:hypothetical protein